MASLPQIGRVTAAVVTGRHPFDVPSFTNALRSMPEIDPYLQSLEEFAADAGGVRDEYDVIVFYNFHQAAPDAAGTSEEKRIRQALDRLGETQQGIVVLHHGLVAYREWEFWQNLVGIPDRGQGYQMDQTFRVEIADPDHPITRGMRPWTMQDETYTINDAALGSHILLTTDHAESMKTLAWTRTFGGSRVFCYQSGHNRTAFEDPNFRTVLSRGIRWSAGRLK